MADIETMELQKAQAAQRMKTLSDETEPGQWDESVQAEWDKAFAEYHNVEAALDARQRAESLQAEASRDQEVRAEAIRRVADEANESEDLTEARADAERSIWLHWLVGGKEGREAETARQAARFTTNGRPLNVITTDGASSTTSGEHTIPTYTREMLLQRIIDIGGMRPVATVMQVDTGAEFQWPTVDSTSQKGEVVAENASATTEDPAFNQVTVKSDMYSSKEVVITRQALQDNVVQLESYIVGLLGYRLGHIQAEYFTVGTSTAGVNALGIVEGSSQGVKLGTGTGNFTNISFDNVLSLVHSLDPAYRRMGAMFMFHDMILLRLKRINDGDSRPLWLPGVGQGAPDTIYGYPYHVNQQMDGDGGSNARTMLYGLLRNYHIWDSRQMTAYRFADEAGYAKTQRVGFIAFMRSAGRLLDVAGNSVKHFSQATAES